MLRIGQSSDIHRLKKGRKLIIGGVHIEHHSGCEAHSDGDVLLHAIAESIIGALAQKDLGSHFSDQDDKYKDMDSMWMLKEVANLMKEQHYEIGNVDSLIMIEEVKMAPFIDLMRINIAQVLQCDIHQINVKATCGEGIGIVGTKQGVIAQSVVLLQSLNNH